MSSEKSYAYVINADNTARRLMIHRDKERSNHLVLQRKEYENIKHPKKNEREDSFTATELKNSRTLGPKPYRGTFLPSKIKEEKSKEKIFYNGDITNFVHRGSDLKQGLDVQRTQEAKLQQAMDDDDKEFYQMSERDRKLFLLKEKCMDEEKRKVDKEYRMDLMKTIKENDKLRDQERSNKMITVERYVLGRQNNAIQLKEDYKKQIRDILETKRKGHDLLAFNNALSELKRYDEMEANKLDELNENIQQKQDDNLSYRQCLKIHRDKLRLDVIDQVVKEKHDKEMARQQWEDTNERAVNKDRLVKRGLSKTLAEKKQVELDKQRVDKIAEEKKNIENKINDYYEALHKKSLTDTDTEKKERLNKVCADIQYRKSLERQMKEDEARRKNKVDMYVRD